MNLCKPGAINIDNKCVIGAKIANVCGLNETKVNGKFCVHSDAKVEINGRIEPADKHFELRKVIETRKTLITAKEEDSTSGTKDTNMTCGYAKVWEERGAMRDIVQNAVDESGNTTKFFRDKDGNIAIRDFGRGLHISDWYMGMSSKVKSTESAAGFFGEGLKVGTLALVCRGHPVKIKSYYKHGDITYEFNPFLKEIETRKGEKEKVLMIDWKSESGNKLKDGEGTDVNISGVKLSNDDIQDVKSRFIKLNEHCVKKLAENGNDFAFKNTCSPKELKNGYFVSGIHVDVTDAEVANPKVNWNVQDNRLTDRDRRNIFFHITDELLKKSEYLGAIGYKRHIDEIMIKSPSEQKVSLIKELIAGQKGDIKKDRWEFFYNINFDIKTIFDANKYEKDIKEEEACIGAFYEALKDKIPKDNKSLILQSSGDLNRTEQYNLKSFFDQIILADTDATLTLAYGVLSKFTDNPWRYYASFLKHKTKKHFGDDEEFTKMREREDDFETPLPFFNFSDRYRKVIQDIIKKTQEYDVISPTSKDIKLFVRMNDILKKYKIINENIDFRVAQMRYPESKTLGFVTPELKDYNKIFITKGIMENTDEKSIPDKVLTYTRNPSGEVSMLIELLKEAGNSNFYNVTGHELAHFTTRDKHIDRVIHADDETDTFNKQKEILLGRVIEAANKIEG